MKLSILDLSPISSDQTAQHALTASMELAQTGERLGYTRYWAAEHHDLPGLACPAPEVLLSYIGARTNTIRIGSGAVLLPHYKAYKVAELFNMMAALFPGRIDLGIGRAPGGSAEVTNALSDNFLQNVGKMPDLVKELLHFLNKDFPIDHKYAKVTASPYPETPPVPWLLGTSKKSGLLAAKNGLAYTFGQFMSDQDGAAIIQEYIDNFQPRKQGDKPQVIVTVSALCAETADKAEEIALSSLIWEIQKDKGGGQQGVPSIEEAKHVKLNEKEKDSFYKKKQKMIIGSPHEVKQKLIDLQTYYQADEIMINTITHHPTHRTDSYKLIAEKFIS
ncbi:LLM class flavin-dependent oxidoreductase [Alteribacillus bidgolensis]|uniref:Luciferase family oxidoreductase, group 1 n=1 Tax=Alteribacillus bidgolensis TaxID=930129 RepID=A0A1G8QJ18_9BACI|nr:LLM class flavin-dependent oxidoreductase [Alteribacillus bidgolensis]SDJ04784.1 luciferase family oxidoreductase, group 1 [Alteribacillus bidgolensis]